MEKTIELKVTADEAAEMRAAIGSMEKGLRILLKEIKHDQAEIEKLRRETRAILAELKAA